MEFLSVENLSFKYPESKEKALDDISFSVNRGDFIVVCGKSGCGKTTLLKMLKKELSPFGEISGEIYFGKENLKDLDKNTSACKIGFVMQNPDNQIVTDKVYRELAFGLENMGASNAEIRRTTGEMACYFGMESLFRSDTATLSGGQKQMLNLASVMVTNPEILILDEPTSQLDPIAANEFISTLKRLNSESGITVIISEHRLEQLLSVADKVLMLDDGKVKFFEQPRELVNKIKIECDTQQANEIMLSMPSATRIYYGLYKSAKEKSKCPLTVKEGRSFLSQNFSSNSCEPELKEYSHSEEKAIELKDVWFRYERNSNDIMRSVNLTVYSGEIFCILGGNGAGKTTALSVISAVNRHYRGKVLIKNKNVRDYKNGSLYKGVLSLLPQNPQTVFIRDTVYEDMQELLKANQIPKEKQSDIIEQTASLLNVTDLLQKHPYDLSGGQQQKCAIAKLLLLRPQILLMDEPTKGLDAYSKKSLAQILLQLKAKGITVLMVTHDVEFAAEYADRCALYFDGEIIAPDTPQRFFEKNKFYTTAAAKISADFCKGAVTCCDVIQTLGGDCDE